MVQIDELAAKFEQALLKLDRVAAGELLAQAVDRWGAIRVVDGVVTPALERIGAGWALGSVALSQVYMSGRICEDLLPAVVLPGDYGRRPQTKLAIAVLEDHHQLGSRIVASVLRSSGFEVLDYGHGIGAQELAERAAREGIQILLISTLMLPSALRVKEVRRRLDELGAGVKIVVGGAPFLFDRQLWREVGADAMGGNGAEAVQIVNRLAREIGQ